MDLFCDLDCRVSFGFVVLMLCVCCLLFGLGVCCDAVFVVFALVIIVVVAGLDLLCCLFGLF